MGDTLGRLARGDALQPLRNIVRLPGGTGMLGVMPAALGAGEGLGAKVLTVFLANHGSAFDSHQGAVLYFEGTHGSLQAILDASAVTAIRTAAVSALATRLLARTEAAELAILGAGVQAITHLEAMLVVRPIRRVRVWTRTLRHAQDFAARAGARHGLPVEACATARDAVRDADIVCTVTSSREPVLLGEWIPPGTHLNAVGSSLPTTRELDSAAVARARLFVDRRESTIHEAGDYLIPLAEGRITEGHILGELGDLLLGRAVGRADSGDITLFKSLGLGLEDVASARLACENARRAGIGTTVEFGGQKYTWD
jgi:ornithine cyclodeaminase